jgi:ABC-type spermidine/putrescine transport system permease subunit I
MRMHTLRSGILAVPDFGWTILFFLAPLAIMVVYSFGQINIISLQMYWGWTVQNYVQIGQSLYLDAILRSLLLSVGATGACLLVGYPLAYWLSIQSPVRQRIGILLMLIPFWSSYLVRTYAIAQLLANAGPLQSLLNHLGLLSGSLGIQYSFTAIGIGIIYSYLPMMVLPLYVVIERIDPAFLHSAADLGARPWRVFWRVTFPLSIPGIVAGCILVGIPATGEYVIPAILGGGKTLMFGNIVESQFLEVGNFPFGSALSVSLMAVVTLFILVGRRLSQSAEDIR